MFFLTIIDQLLMRMIRVVFFIDDAPGATPDAYQMQSVKAEAMLFGDIIQANFIDSYR